MASIRVSPPRVFPDATRAPKPPAGSGGSVDAHRQTSFVLGKDVDLILRGLELEGGVAQASSGAKYRKQLTAAGLGLWSRGWLVRLEALHAVEWGNYAAAFVLCRAAADYEASELYVLRDVAAEWQEWLDDGGLASAPAEHGTEYRLHAFRAAEILAAHEILGPVYRTAMDLSMPHFGATLLLAGNDSGPERVLMTFGDRDFHLGLAEIALGWLLSLGVAQLEAAIEFEGVFGIPARDVVEAHSREARAAAAARDRCFVETIERDGERRYLVQNWRRAPGAAPRRILL